MSCLKIGIADKQMCTEAKQKADLTVKMRSRSRKNEIKQTGSYPSTANNRTNIACLGKTVVEKWTQP